MADSQRTFILRVVSSVLALLFLIGCGYYGGADGLQAVCIGAILWGMREFSRMILKHWQFPSRLITAYMAIAILILPFLIFYFDYAFAVFTLGNLTYLATALWLARGKVSNEQLLGMMAIGCFGFVSCLMFPFFAFKIAGLENGIRWFLLLLLIVFSGDTFAYFGGRFFGRHKMMPAVSPNKTWEGCVAGVLGSCFAGMYFLFINFDAVSYRMPWWQGLAFCILCALAAQSGDLLMSLVKRVAQIKDSGHIMPGHGGILDRLDGVYTAAPLVYSFALYVTYPF